MRRRQGLSQKVQDHLQANKSLYLFVTVLFMMGVIFGAVIVNAVDAAQKSELYHYVNSFFQMLKQDGIADPQVAFQHSFGDHLKTIGLMWILGLSVIGIPFLLIYIFMKGLVVGFTIGFLINQLAWKGVWFAFAAVVPQNILLIPAFIVIAVSGIRFSTLFIQNRMIYHRGTVYPQFVAFSLLVTGMVVLVLLSTGIEAFISPHLMKGVVPLSIDLPSIPKI